MHKLSRVKRAARKLDIARILRLMRGLRGLRSQPISDVFCLNFAPCSYANIERLAFRDGKRFWKLPRSTRCLLYGRVHFYFILSRFARTFTANINEGLAFLPCQPERNASCLCCIRHKYRWQVRCRLTEQTKAPLALQDECLSGNPDFCHFPVVALRWNNKPCPRHVTYDSADSAYIDRKRNILVV